MQHGVVRCLARTAPRHFLVTQLVSLRADMAHFYRQLIRGASLITQVQLCQRGPRVPERPEVGRKGDTRQILAQVCPVSEACSRL